MTSFKPQRGKFTPSPFNDWAIGSRFKPQRGKFTLYKAVWDI